MNEQLTSVCPKKSNFAPVLTVNNFSSIVVNNKLSDFLIFIH